MSEDRIIKREVVNASIDVHPSMPALVIDYDEINIILTSSGRERASEPTSLTKTIRLQGFDMQTDIHQLAEEIVAKCTLVNPVRLPEIEQLLHYLQNRRDNYIEPTNQANSDEAPKEEAHFDEVDNYVDLLYEEIEDKERAAALILQLAKNIEYLEDLLHKETVLTALARVLREDWNRSMQLSSDILYIFFCFSNFVDFHHMIGHFKVGALCMTILEEELTRAIEWKNELDAATKVRGQEDQKKLHKRYKSLIKKQDSLFRIGLYLLLNLAESADVQYKMRAKGIITILIRIIQTRQSPPVLLLAASFLQKMSVFLENKNEMKKHKLPFALLEIITNPQRSTPDLINLCLRLLLNLSFDSDLRVQMTESHLVPPVAKIASVVEDSPQRQVGRCLLYQLSREERARSLLSYTDAFPILVSQALNCKGDIPIELNALLINTALSRPNAELLVKHNKGKTSRSLVKRALKTRDPLLLKTVRNIAFHEGFCKEAMLPFIGNFASNVRATDETFAVECIGTLANLNLQNIDYSLVLQEYDLIKWLKEVFDDENKVADDIVLESVLLAGTAAIDDQCANLLAKEGIVQQLVNLLKAKQEDDELVCQIVYVFYQMVFHDCTRQSFLETNAPAYLIDLMHDSNSQVRKVCDSTLDIICEFSKEISDQIRMEKFRWHNSQWLDMMEGRMDGHDNLDYDEDYINGEFENEMNNLLLYDNNEYNDFSDIPPEFRPDERSGFYESQGPDFYQNQQYIDTANYY